MVIALAMVAAASCTEQAARVANPEQLCATARDEGSNVASVSLGDLAIGVRQKTLIVKSQEQFTAAFRAIREAAADPLVSTDGDLLVIARDGGTVSPEIALEAMGQLFDRGKARPVIRGFVEDWRTNPKRAADAMQVLAVEATADELALFRKVAEDAFDELPAGQFASVGQSTSSGLTVAHWVKSLAPLDAGERLKAIARMAAPLGEYPIDLGHGSGYAYPLCRRAARELRKAFDLDPRWTLECLRDIELLPPYDPNGPPDFLTHDPVERKRLEDARREGLISLLPTSAREQWTAIKKR